MTSRITHQTVQRQTLTNLQRNLGAMSRLQEQLASGKTINRPSDDPSATASLLHLKAGQRALALHQRNVSDADSWLTTVDSALTSSLALLRNARELTVQGGDGALGPASREALATDLEGVRDALLAQANTTYLGRSVFAGTSDTAAFTDGTWAWSGAAGTVERAVADGVTVRVDADGSAAFGQGAGSVFATLTRVAATLRSGGDPTTDLAAIDTHLDDMLTQVASVGARHRQVLAARSAGQSTELALKTRVSAVEDIDLAQVILDLQQQEVAYKGALGAAARVLQPSLLDFLR